MKDIIDQLESYRFHVDHALDRASTSEVSSNDPTNELELIMLDTMAKETQNVDTNRPRLRWRLTTYAAAAAVLFVGLIAITAWQRDGSSTAVSSKEGADGVIEGYFSARNAKDVDAMMEFFDDESVIVGFPPTGRRSAGLEEIRSTMTRDVSVQDLDGSPYSISNLAVAGDTVTWDHVWTNYLGSRYCATGHSAVVEGGVIRTWTWPTSQSCSDISGVVRRHFAAYNSDDIDSMMAAFSEESVIIGHPIFGGEDEGLDEIRKTLRADLSLAANPDAYKILNLEASGKAVTWDHEWTSKAGEKYCAEGHEAIVEDGVITTWTWPATRPCG